MDETLVTDDETESLGVAKEEAIFGNSVGKEKGRWNDSMTSWSNLSAQRSGGSQKRIVNLLDCQSL